MYRQDSGHGKAGALESVTQALELSKGWSVTVEVKKGSTDGVGATAKPTATSHFACA